MLVIVEEALYPAGIGHQAGSAVGGVAFTVDAKVPILERRRRNLGFYAQYPGVFPGRLIKMTVNYEVAAGQYFPPGG
jgi:hypothetical protein